MAAARSIIVLILFFMFQANAVLAQVETITVTEKCVGGDNDSKIDVRRLCSFEAKRKILEKIGTIIQSKTTVKNYQLTENELTAYSAAILKTEIIAEQWGTINYNPALTLTLRAEVDASILEKNFEKKQRQEEKQKKEELIQDKLKQTSERLEELEQALDTLKSQSTGTTSPIQAPRTKIEDSSSWPWWYWAVGAVVVGAVGIAASRSSESSSGSGGSSDSCAAGAGNCGSTVITW